MRKGEELPKIGYKFTPEQLRNMSLGHIGQVAWNKGNGGCKQGHDPNLYVAMPSGVKVCLGCKRKNGAKYRAKNREQIRLKTRLGRYNISIDDFQVLWHKQNGLCAICGKSLEGIKYRIDHDHNTTLVRGLLCVSCNTGIGFLKDSPEVLTNAARYLTNGNGG